MYSQPSEADHQALVSVCFAFLQRNGREAGRLMVDHAKTKSAYQIKEEIAFCEGVQGLVDDAMAKNYFEVMLQ